MCQVSICVLEKSHYFEHLHCSSFIVFLYLSSKNPKSKKHFSLVLPSGVRRWLGFHHARIFDKVSSTSVIKRLQQESRLFIGVILVGAGSGNRTRVNRLETCGNGHYTMPARCSNEQAVRICYRDVIYSTRLFPCFAFFVRVSIAW